MKNRFEGQENRSTLIETLREQRIVNGDASLAQHVANVGELLEIAAGTSIIEQGAEDRDVYLILTGAFDIVVNGRIVGKRGPGNHVGEMAAIQPTQRRSAAVTACESSVVCRLTELKFAEVGRNFAEIWRAVAKELARRLEQRNALVTNTREKINVFVISSEEAIEIARTIQNGFAYDPFLVTVWTDGVFRASHYPIESLERQLDQSDFAIAIAQPDDMTESRGQSAPTPRDSVIFELGLFIGRIGRTRSFLVEPRHEEVKLPSDLYGITTLPYRYTGPKELSAALGPACNCIRNIIRELGPNN